MIVVKRSKKADSRSADGDFSKAELMRDTKLHIQDVRHGMEFIADKLTDAGNKHDHTKLENFDAFYNALKKDHVKESFWYNLHITTERHHLLSNPRDDVTLIDVIEHIVDCVMAGSARSGKVYDIELPPDLLEKAVKNTVDMLLNEIEVKE